MKYQNTIHLLNIIITMHKYLHCQNFNDQAIESKREEIFSLLQSYRQLSATVQPFGASLSEKFSDLFACFAGAK